MNLACVHASQEALCTFAVGPAGPAWIECDRDAMVITDAHYDQQAELPCQPIEQSCQRAECAIKWLRRIPDRQVDDSHRRRDGLLTALRHEQSPEGAMNQIDQQSRRRRNLGLSIERIGLQDWANVNGRPKRRARVVEIPVDHR